uniref:ADAM10 endopeptidase n=1 Tax=Acrobeloides nanus TaxID=290746 RepID=A0A914EM41_9BILA
MEKIQTSAESPSASFFDEPIYYRSHLLPHDDFHSYANTSRPKRNIHISFQQPQLKEINNHRLFTVRTCSIYLQADQKLYEHIFHKEGNRDHVRTREEIVSLFYNHIKAVNQIYETTDFGGILGLNFVIQRTTIYTKDTCQGNKPAPGSDNPFCEENVDVSNFLNLNSQKNHSAFCLAYALTFRDFVGGTLGLAWVASPNFNTAGGVCQVYQKYNEGSRGMVYRSLNTGIVSLINYGNRVPSRVSQLTLAHEIGHNFGSPHDFPLECQPGLPDGNYIMFASATSGDKVNNARFSPCSVANISLVLYEVLSQTPVDPQHSYMPVFGKKRNCFQERTSAFCGNQIREPGEECDCGFSDRDCQQMADHCCTPHEIGGRFYGSNACKRRPNARCSPSEGQCCNGALCGFYSAKDQRVCREESECLYSQTCDGRGPECPDSQPKPDGLPCQDATKVCQSGSCNGSICAQVGLKDCFLTEGKPSQLCHLACEKNGKCLSSFEMLEFGIGKFPQTGREDKSGLLLHPGSPCNNYKGYCDIFRKCRSVDSNGPLARLKNLLFNKQTINTVSQWAQENWWACVLMGIGVLFFMAVFVKCCAVHTPSTNPNKLPAQHFSETLRHPGTLLRRGRHRPQAYAIAVAGPPPVGVTVQPTGGGPAARTARNQQRQRQQQRPSSSNQHNRAPANLSAPPLIPQTSPTAPSGTNDSSAPPPQLAPSTPAVAPPVTNEPPPPYTPSDPSSVIEALPAAAVVVAPVPVPLPGPPGPAIPLVVGPPIPGQGPKAGRRKNPKATGGKDVKKDEKKPQKKK